MVPDVHLLKYFLQLHNELRPPDVLLPDVLKVHGVLDTQRHVDLVHIQDVLQVYCVDRVPMCWFALQVPESKGINEN